jgi:hypothetical protein
MPTVRTLCRSMPALQPSLPRAGDHANTMARTLSRRVTRGSKVHLGLGMPAWQRPWHTAQGLAEQALPQRPAECGSYPTR